MKHGREIRGYFWNRAADAWAGGQVHHEGEAKCLRPSTFPTTHQNLLSHLYLALKPDFANTCTKVWVWIEGTLDGFHWPSLLCSCLLPANDGCWLHCPSPVGLDVIWTVLFITFAHVLRVMVQVVGCIALIGIPVNPAGSFSASTFTSQLPLGLLALTCWSFWLLLFKRSFLSGSIASSSGGPVTPGSSSGLCANGLEGWFHLGAGVAVKLPIKLISQDLSKTWLRRKAVMPCQVHW